MCQQSQSYQEPGGQQIARTPAVGGNPVMMAVSSRSRGSIPAWAGEPFLSKDIRHFLSVYPRVGGGTYPV